MKMRITALSMMTRNGFWFGAQDLYWRLARIQTRGLGFIRAAAAAVRTLIESRAFPPDAARLLSQNPLGILEWSHRGPPF